jgi:hypothetical protein
MCKKSFCKILTLSSLCTPIIVLMVINLMRVKPESYKPIFQANAVEVKNAQPNSKTIVQKQPQRFLDGYHDGWSKKWLGPINWTFSDDYRHGHMLGSYDRKNGNNRYPENKDQKHE